MTSGRQAAQDCSAPLQNSYSSWLVGGCEARVFAIVVYVKMKAKQFNGFFKNLRVLLEHRTDFIGLLPS